MSPRCAVSGRNTGPASDRGGNAKEIAPGSIARNRQEPARASPRNSARRPDTRRDDRAEARHHRDLDTRKSDEYHPLEVSGIAGLRRQGSLRLFPHSPMACQAALLLMRLSAVLPWPFVWRCCCATDFPWSRRASCSAAGPDPARRPVDPRRGRPAIIQLTAASGTNDVPASDGTLGRPAPGPAVLLMLGF